MSGTTGEITVAALEAALARGEFIYEYQPKVSLVSGRMCGAEALIRWHRSDGTAVPPADFIPLAERSGFITEITFGMLPKLVSDLAIIQAVNPALVLSFNASARDFDDDRLVEALGNILDLGLARAAEIEIEVTESAMLVAGPAVVQRLQELRRRGLLLAMDDFATGYSAINVLSRLPFTTIKIDQGLVSRMDNPLDATVVESSIRMAHRLGLDVVAEGVETEDQYVRLQSVGCGLVQGYWISRPLSLDGFVTLVQEAPRYPANPAGLLHMAILDHIDWRKSLLDALISKEKRGWEFGDAMVGRLAMDPEDCRFGRWYYGPGREHAGLIAYRNLGAPHAALHEAGKRIVEASRRGVTFSGLCPLLRQLTAHSARVIALLQEFEHVALQQNDDARLPRKMGALEIAADPHARSRRQRTGRRAA